MKNIFLLIVSLLFISCVTGATPDSSSAATDNNGKALASSCQPLTDEILHKIETDGPKPIRLIFFSSWCSCCKDRIVADYPEKTYLIGVFDSDENIQRAYQHQPAKYPCYFDHGLAEKKYNIRFLPEERILKKVYFGN